MKIDDPLASTFNSFFKNSNISTYKKRTLILHPNDIPSSVFYIKNGYVRVFRISEDGEELTLTILRPQDFFPLTYGIHSVVNPFYLEAITPLEIWKAPQEQFLSFIKSNPDIYMELTSRILVRFDGVLSRMEYLVFCNAYIKVATTLLVCAKRFGETVGEDIMLDVPLTHRDIATLVGITRETTSLEMKKLEKQGYLGKIGKNLIIRNCKKLEEEILLSAPESSQLTYSL